MQSVDEFSSSTLWCACCRYMIVAPSETIRLNGQTYTLEGLLGQGLLAQTWQARLPELPGAPTVALRLPTTQYEAVTAMHAEAQTLTRLNRAEDPAWPEEGLLARIERARQTNATRVIVTMLDTGLHAHGGPFVVQELAPPSFTPAIPTSLDDERLLVEVAAAVARAMVLCHQIGVSLHDFASYGGKADRIRATVVDGKLQAVRLIDWNVSGPASSAACAADRLMLGGQLYQYALGLAVPPGTARATLQRLESAPLSAGLREIIARLLLSESVRAYPSAQAVAADLAQLAELLTITDPALLLRRADQFLPQPLWRLAAADLGLRWAQEATTRKWLAAHVREARVQLDRREQLELDTLLLHLHGRRFQLAEAEGRRLLADASLAPSLTRAARLYWLLARAGSALGKTEQGQLHISSWEALYAATTQLVRADWASAVRTLAVLDQLVLPTPLTEVGTTLRDLAHALVWAHALLEGRVALPALPQSLAELRRWDATQIGLPPEVAQLARVVDYFAIDYPALSTATATLVAYQAAAEHCGTAAMELWKAERAQHEAYQAPLGFARVLAAERALLALEAATVAVGGLSDWAELLAPLVVEARGLAQAVRLEAEQQALAAVQLAEAREALARDDLVGAAAQAHAAAVTAPDPQAAVHLGAFLVELGRYLDRAEPALQAVAADLAAGELALVRARLAALVAPTLPPDVASPPRLIAVTGELARLEQALSAVELSVTVMSAYHERGHAQAANEEWQRLVAQLAACAVAIEPEAPYWRSLAGLPAPSEVVPPRAQRRWLAVLALMLALLLAFGTGRATVSRTPTPRGFVIALSSATAYSTRPAAPPTGQLRADELVAVCSIAGSWLLVSRDYCRSELGWVAAEQMLPALAP
jgi:hypothetical protein